MSDQYFDVLIVGAGISGINAGFRVQDALPEYTYTILESRHELGGTWSLFKYPGIRSDSDLYTFGFPWDPWPESKPIATGSSIMTYLRTVASKHGIDKHIQYRHKLLHLDWQSDLKQWKVDVLVNETERKTFHAKFVVLGTGYYDYNEALPAKIPGIEKFKGKVVHPQFWPEKLDYADKRVVIVGSGATAVTLLPTMSEKAKHITMLQRSPGYIISLPQKPLAPRFYRSVFPASLAAKLVRIHFIVISWLFALLCHYRPYLGRRILRGRVSRQLPPNMPLDPHFDPKYFPWQQRLCMSPDGDIFDALRSGKASIVTDQIETVTKTGIKLKSGQTLDADIIITATGLKVAPAGNATISIDGGDPIVLRDKFIWRNTMLQDVPNLAYIFGYTNASWTLGSDITARMFVTLLVELKKRGKSIMMPYMESSEQVEEVDLLGLNSTYVQDAKKRGLIPKAGNIAPWKPRSSYPVDWWHLMTGDKLTGLKLE